MRRFLRPAWLVSHLLVLALIITMVNLGLWQLRRLDERQVRNDLQTQRSSAPGVSVGELADQLGIDALLAAAVGNNSASATGLLDDAEFRVVTAEGRYLAGEEVAVRNRPLGGRPGVWLLTPLLLEDGSALVVNRGWVSQSSAADDSRPPAPVPDGQVRVSGIVRLSETRQGLGVADPPEGRLTSLARADIVRYAAQLTVPVYPFYLQLEGQEPSPENFPVPLRRPPLDSGPHLGYAVQWFVFSSIGALGYPLVLWRLLRRRTVIPAEEAAPA